MSTFELAEDFLPIYDVSDAVATVADADREMAWKALLEVDLVTLGREAPVVGMLGALRMLPEIVGHLLHGERPAKPPASMRLRDLPSIPMHEGGWILLGERAGQEIALGLVGKFWRPVIEFARITSADEFRRFDEPGFAKTVYDFSVRELDAHNDAPLGPHADRDHRRARAPLVSPLLDLWRWLGCAHPRRRAARLGTARRRGRPGGEQRRRMQGGAVKTRPLRPLEAVRAFGVMLGRSIALAAAAASTVAVAPPWCPCTGRRRWRWSARQRR
jgi:hypothetical protein